MAQIVCLGELLIDFVSLDSGVTLMEAPAFKKAAGGAPANVAVGAARLECEAAFIGKVGRESFGEFLTDVLQENHVNVSGISYDDEARTMLAFVSVTDEGERDFMFYRHPSADMRLTPEDIPEELIKQAHIFHYGSISLISEPCRSATLHALDLARQAEVVCSYDPNLRLGLWESEDLARKEMLQGMRYADVVKINDDELDFLTGTRDVGTGTQQLLDMGPQLVVITMGRGGCCCCSRTAQVQVAGFPIQAIDTTGAGDGFTAGLLSQLLNFLTPHAPFTVPDSSMLEQMARFANAVGAITALERGAIPSLPGRQQVVEFLAAQS